jgi:hypothetical protein
MLKKLLGKDEVAQKFYILGYFLLMQNFYIFTQISSCITDLKVIQCIGFELSNRALMKIFWPFLLANCFGYFLNWAIFSNPLCHTGYNDNHESEAQHRYNEHDDTLKTLSKHFAECLYTPRRLALSAVP